MCRKSQGGYRILSGWEVAKRNEEVVGMIELVRCTRSYSSEQARTPVRPSRWPRRAQPHRAVHCRVPHTGPGGRPRREGQRQRGDVTLAGCVLAVAARGTVCTRREVRVASRYGARTGVWEPR
jgi:hypothetical protein